ncbi:hypothetical protein ACFX1W_029676 [Malus domestica]
MLQPCRCERTLQVEYKTFKPVFSMERTTLFRQCLETVTVMLGRNLLLLNLHSTRGWSSAAASFLRFGRTLKRTRVFTNEDVLQYSKVSHDSNPLHFDSLAAGNAGSENRLVQGCLSTLEKRWLVRYKAEKKRYLVKFKMACFSNGSTVIAGEAMAILPTLAAEQANTWE